MDLAKLKTELTSDPAGLGYAANIGDHTKLAKLISKPNRELDDPGEKSSFILFEAFDLDEVKTALGDPIKSKLLALLVALPMVTFDSTKKYVSDVFGGQNSKSYKAWRKAAKRQGSRADELGLGNVTESDVADALLRTP